MLTSLLPGLRDVRAPLASGVLILFSMLLFFGGHVDQVGTESGRSELLSDMISWVDRPGIVAIALFTSYLIGSAVVTFIGRVIASFRERAIYRFDLERGPRVVSALQIEEVVSPLSLTAMIEHAAKPPRPSTYYSWDLPFWLPFSGESLESLLNALEEHVSSFDREMARGRLGKRHQLLMHVLRGAYRDGGRRLLLASSDLYTEYDRKRSEAELRYALIVTIPVAALGFFLNSSLTIGTEVVATIGIAMTVTMFFRQAMALERAAHSLVLGALADHTISVPVLDSVAWR
jgi:hypothetical protein